MSVEYLYNTMMYIYVELNYDSTNIIIGKKNDILMYIVLSSQIVNHFGVHYRDIDKLRGCLNVFFIIIIISYLTEVFSYNNQLVNSKNGKLNLV